MEDAMEDVTGFNPTRVRLKREYTMVFDDGDELQPHEGSSETASSPTASPQFGQLQPHEGSSETDADERPAAGPTGFNPTRVRLKLRRLLSG